MEPKKSTYWKFVGAFLGIIFLAFALLIGWNYFEFKRGEQAVQDLAEGMEAAEKELYQMQLADTYGGKTPQETLQMYIDAVEAGDYELASKYFVIEKQEEWRTELEEIKQSGKLEIFLDPLKSGDFSRGEYSADQKSFSIYNPVGVDFVFYPSSVWKILEI